MKMYVVNTRSGERWFYDHESLIKFLAAEKSKMTWSGSNRVSVLNFMQVKTAEVEFLDEFGADSYLQSHIETTNREVKLEAVFGDDFSKKVDKFKTMFEQLATDNVLKRKFKTKLDTIPVDKKNFSKLFTANVGYLFAVDYSVEWYRAILDIHNFKKIEDSYHRELVSKSGLVSSSNVKVNDEAKKNFAIAKNQK